MLKIHIFDGRQNSPALFILQKLRESEFPTVSITVCQNLSRSHTRVWSYTFDPCRRIVAHSLVHFVIRWRKTGSRSKITVVVSRKTGMAASRAILNTLTQLNTSHTSTEYIKRTIYNYKGSHDIVFHNSFTSGFLDVNSKMALSNL